MGRAPVRGPVAPHGAGWMGADLVRSRIVIPAAILVTAAAPSVPLPLLAQLSPDGGRLVMPVGDREHQWLTLVVRNGDEYASKPLEPVVFVPLLGEHGLSEGR